MNSNRHLGALVIALTVGFIARSQPFDPKSWPPAIVKTAKVQFVSVGENLPAPHETWVSNLAILSGGDQQTTDIEIGGYPAKKAAGNYINIANENMGYTQWADEATIDILVQVYGDAGILGADGKAKNYNFLTGTLPELAAPTGGQIPVEAKNAKWNWVLFRIENRLRPSDGSRMVGSIPANAQGATANAGVNGGTIRMEGVPNLIIRAMAWGPEGAFGTLEDYQKFAPAAACDPEPNTNHVFHDLASNTKSHLEILTGGDQASSIETGIGPTGDKRRSVKPTGNFLNFGIADNFLGKPCNDPRTIKVCVEYYDDPALKDTVSFGPEAYATDAGSGIGFMPETTREKLKGTGKWQRRSWTIPSANLRGVNTVPATGGPRFAFNGGAVYISRIDIAVVRIGDHPLAGKDPLADCFADTTICLGVYGDYAEMDLAKGVLDGLAPGSSGGDQEMIQEEAGPAGSRRMSIRPAHNDGSPAFSHQYLNLAITDEKLGPSTQPNARLAICMTYYDDPALAGRSFRPEVYQSERNGTETFAFTGADSAIALEGTDKWRDAYFELPDVKFTGVNQGPQAAARIFVNGKIAFSRVRYAVIRPCGPTAGVNLLAACKPSPVPVLALTASRPAGGKIRLSWSRADGVVVQGSDLLTPPSWKNLAGTPTTEGDTSTLEVPIGSAHGFYRVVKP